MNLLCSPRPGAGMRMLPERVRKLEGKSRNVDVAIFFMVDPPEHLALFQVLVVIDLRAGVSDAAGYFFPFQNGYDLL